jgi:class 3 adenylate cyclase
MNLRTKIFLLVGGLFFVAFVSSQVFEEYVTSRNLDLQTQTLNNKIIENQEAKRQEAQRFSRAIIEHNTDMVAVLINKIREYQWLRNGFTPSVANLENQTWLAASDLMYMNKWIDFIENTNEGQITSLIVLDDHRPSVASRISDRGLFSYFMLKNRIEDQLWQGPYLGVPYFIDIIDFDATRRKEVQTDSEIISHAAFYFLFKPEAIMKIEPAKMQEVLTRIKTGQYLGKMDSSDQRNFPYIIERVINSIEQIQNEFKKDLENYHLLLNGQIPPALGVDKNSLNASVSEFSKRYQEAKGIAYLDLRYEELSMLWQIGSILSTDLFGSEPFAETFPLGMAEVPPGSAAGQAVINKSIFYDQPQFTANQYAAFDEIYGEPLKYQRVVLQDSNQRLFFGGQIEIIDALPDGTNRKGTLTLGVNANPIVEGLALATSSETFFVSQGNVIKGFSSTGVELSKEELLLPLEKIQDLNSGFFSREGTEFFFMRLVPYPGFDINFYLVIPKYRAFSLSNSLKENARELIRTISIQMQFISFAALLLVLFSLNHIAKHVTDPIVHLARACKILKSGRLDEVHLPKLLRKAKDEIYLLYYSFDEMIQGLKEKEKVQGVLNKVVSPTIAQEILKGNIHLGGEEREVTVLFADIRRFTKISESMEPHDLINMLNTCMTKVSHVIDAAGGVIDKYVGDEVMALFGAPLPDKDGPQKAIKCAFEIMKVLEDWNCLRAKDHLPLVQMGIGIHTGMVIVGNMGAENRLNYTVLGTNVNLASRLCSIAGPGQILISQPTLSAPHVSELVNVKSLDKVLLKGFSDPIEVFVALPK